MLDSLEAQRVISRYRNKAIVITTMTPSREWPQVSTSLDLDLPLIDGMGKASSLGLGLALAQPGRRVFVLDSDGSLLMNLGSLVTIANMAPPNLVHFLFENSIYRTTGGQTIPGAGKFSFIGLAREAGYNSVHEFDDLASLEDNIETVLNQAGPTFVCLKVPPLAERPPYPFLNTARAIPRFREAVQRPSP